ncbi:hypothetical protein ACGFMK_39525 [Amycolatopsis sp. NPDC049252]|uniref:hypothetical protein n=1 Tax=Amycolatopsis sp. NPDC049252 TaxID=3363933 RepID=UPI00371BED42
MSWQEDLRRLDADLAAGRIEPSAHRKQRDELLAAASGATVPSPVPSPLRRPTERTWQSANPGFGRLSEPTSEPRPVPKPPTPAERPWMRTQQPGAKTHPPIPALPDHMTTAPSPADITPTRYLRVDGPSAHHTTPSRFPPVVSEGSAPPLDPPEPDARGKHRWEHLGADDAEGSSRRPTWLFLTLGVVLVLALIVGGTYWLGTRSDEPSEAALPPTTPPPVPSLTLPSATNGAIDPSVSLEQRLPALPGKPNADNSTMSIDKALEAKVITEADAAQIRNNNAKEIIFRASSDTGKPRDGNLMMAIPTLSVFDAKHLAAGLRQNLSGAKLAATRLGPTEDDLMYTQRGNDNWVGILWYSSGAVVVGIGVSQAGTADSTGLRSRLKAIQESVVAVLPPG